MTRLTHFSTPANIDDFTDFPAQREQMKVAWSANVNRWCNAAMLGNVWTAVNDGPRPAFYNPMLTDTPTSATTQTIPWNAFPGRMQALLTSTEQERRQWADEGVPADVLIHTDLCSGQRVDEPYGPPGPRGWQDEYCEWSVKRNSTGAITAVSFTCENPEYWFTLWQVDPTRVLALYQRLVGPQVQMADLVLTNGQGHAVSDPTTGRAAYNPLNRWNSGTQSLSTGGGAVHLTSSPNSLGAEFDLAAAATLPRADDNGPVTDATELMCFGGFGEVGRRSDPTIGATVNQIVNEALLQGMATLTDPVGLYMQTPDFRAYALPDGSDASACWTVVRGRTRSDPNDIDRILHATFSVPPGKNFTVSDITIGGQPIRYGSQIAETITMALMATAFGDSGVVQTPVGAADDSKFPQPYVNALQAWDVFEAYCQLELNTTQSLFFLPRLAFNIEVGKTISNVALLLSTGQAPTSASFSVPAGGVTITVNGQRQLLNTPYRVFLVTIAADPTAEPGDRAVLANVPGQTPANQGAIGVLAVTPATAQQVPVRLGSTRGRF